MGAYYSLTVERSREVASSSFSLRVFVQISGCKNHPSRSCVEIVKSIHSRKDITKIRQTGITILHHLISFHQRINERQWQGNQFRRATWVCPVSRLSAWQHKPDRPSGLSALSFGHGASFIWIKVDFRELASVSCIYSDTVGFRRLLPRMLMATRDWLRHIVFQSYLASLKLPRYKCETDPSASEQPRRTFMHQWFLDRKSHNAPLK